jgi:hypothetical protein
MRRSWIVAVALLVGLIGLNAGPAAACPALWARPVTVGGAVATPATYSLSALESLPQTTLSITRHTWWGSQTSDRSGSLDRDPRQCCRADASQRQERDASCDRDGLATRSGGM